MAQSETPILSSVMPPAMMERAVALMQEGKHYWIATVGFEMDEDELKQEKFNLDSSKIQFQNLRCVICMMPYKKGRAGRICPGINDVSNVQRSDLRASIRAALQQSFR